MINVVKKFFRELKTDRAERRQREINDRWLCEFTEIYTSRVEAGRTREEADKRFDDRLRTAAWNITMAWWGMGDAELAVMRAEVHTAVDTVLLDLDEYGGTWRDDVMGERPFENSRRETAVYCALTAADRSEREKEDVIMELRKWFGNRASYDLEGTA